MEAVREVELSYRHYNALFAMKNGGIIEYRRIDWKRRPYRQIAAKVVEDGSTIELEGISRIQSPPKVLFHSLL